MSEQVGVMKDLRGFFAEGTSDFPILLAYLFGSRAKGTAAPESDYDIGVLFGEEITPEIHYLLQHRLAQFLTSQVDLVNLAQAPIELVYNVIVNGQIIYERDPSVRGDFESDMLNRYYDRLPSLRAQRKKLLEETREDYERGVQRYRAALGATEKLLAQARTTEDKIQN